MKEANILVQVIGGVIESAKSAGLGRHAVKIANGIEGLTVSPYGGITITGNALAILGDLIREYEGAMKASLITEVRATLHVLRYAYAAPDWRHR
jgi:hypothetical protein